MRQGWPWRGRPRRAREVAEAQPRAEGPPPAPAPGSSARAGGLLGWNRPSLRGHHPLRRVYLLIGGTVRYLVVGIWGARARAGVGNTCKCALPHARLLRCGRSAQPNIHPCPPPRACEQEAEHVAGALTDCTRLHAACAAGGGGVIKVRRRKRACRGGALSTKCGNPRLNGSTTGGAGQGDPGMGPRRLTHEANHAPREAVAWGREGAVGRAC